MPIEIFTILQIVSAFAPLVVLFQVWDDLAVEYSDAGCDLLDFLHDHSEKFLAAAVGFLASTIVWVCLTGAIA